MNKPFLIEWKSRSEWRGKAIVMAITPIQAWERFILKWNEDYEAGNIDLNSNEIDEFSVELAADEFIGE